MTEICEIKPEIVALSTRLETLMSNVKFRSDYNQALDSPEQLLAIGEHNRRELEKLKAMGEEHKERIWDLMSAILASGLQEEALEKYGNTDSSSIRLVLSKGFNSLEVNAFWNKLRHTTERSLLGIGLTDEQCQAVMKNIYDRLPEAMIECLEELYSRSCYLPRSEAQPIATALADMMKEVAP